MALKSENFEIYLDTTDKAMKYINFVLKGNFTPTVSDRFISCWKRAFSMLPNDCFTLIWDFAMIGSFERSVREDWIRCLQQFQNKIEKIVIISERIVL